jgi:hypothetical protein
MVRTAFRAKVTNFDSIVNPGARLYQKGIHLNNEKAKFIENQRRQLQDREIQDHCTFQPKLMTKDYQQICENSSSKYHSEATMDEFHQDSQRNPRVPAITIEKLIVKDGEQIHVKKMKSPMKVYNHHPTFAGDDNVNFVLNAVDTSIGAINIQTRNLTMKRSKSVQAY